MIERLLVGLNTAMLFLGGGVFTVAQAVFDPDGAGLDRIVGGSVIIVGAVWAMRVVRNVSAEERKIRSESMAAMAVELAEVRKAHREDRDAWAVDRDAWARQRHELQNQLGQCRVANAKLQRTLVQSGITPPDGTEIT